MARSYFYLQIVLPSFGLQPGFSPASNLGAHNNNGWDPNVGPVIFPQVPSPHSTIFSANLSLCSQSLQSFWDHSGRFPFVMHLRVRPKKGEPK